MVKNCKCFKCVQKETCSENCPGGGAAAYRKCGCDVCAYQSFIGDGDVEICEISLMLREAEMEEELEP